jgi:hypothetical protein
MWLARLLKPITHARELLLCYTSKKVTSKLHKLTNYKSNYTSKIYIKVNTSLCWGIANQWDEQGWCGDFYPEVHLVATKLVPVVTTTHLVVRWLISVHKPSPHVGRRKNLPTSEGSSMTHSTSVALRGSRGVSTVPLTNPSSEHRTIFLHASRRRTRHQAI